VAWNPLDGVWTSFEQAVGSDMDAGSKRFLDVVHAADPQTPKLMIAEVDHSADYAECFAESGYYLTEFVTDPREELRNKEHLASVSNEWARCARSNGHTEIEDARRPVIDGYATNPEILVPLTVEPDELRRLLNTCPLAGKSAKGEEGLVYPNVVPASPSPDASYENGVLRAAELHNVLFEQ
jgi:hypothetical protein